MYRLQIKCSPSYPYWYGKTKYTVLLPMHCPAHHYMYVLWLNSVSTVKQHITRRELLDIYVDLPDILVAYKTTNMGYENTAWVLMWYIFAISTDCILIFISGYISICTLYESIDNFNWEVKFELQKIMRLEVLYVKSTSIDIVRHWLFLKCNCCLVYTTLLSNSGFSVRPQRSGLTSGNGLLPPSHNLN